MAVPKSKPRIRVVDAQPPDPLPMWAVSDDPETFLRGYEELRLPDSPGFKGRQMTDAERALLAHLRRKGIALGLQHPDLHRRIRWELISEEKA